MEMHHCPRGHRLPGGRLGAVCPTCLAAPPRQDFGVHIPGLDLRSRLGAGGSGQVFLAKDALDGGRIVAVKVVPAAAAEDRDRLAREFAAVARLNHPLIVRVYRSGTTAAAAWFTMDAVDGDPLTAIIPVAPVNRPMFVALMRDVAAALQTAHSSGVFHFDLSPANILVTDDSRPVVIDFGCGRTAEDRRPLLKADTVGVTRGFTAPEIVAGTLGTDYAAADVFGLGAVLVAGLTGHPPSKEMNWPRGVSKDMRAVCAKCLCDDPADRYPTAGALAEDLTRVLTGHPPAARKPGSMTRSWYAVKRRPITVAAVTALSLAAAGAAGFAAYREVSQAAADAAQAKTLTIERLRADADWYARVGDFDRAEKLYAEVSRQSGRLDFSAELKRLRAAFQANRLTADELDAAWNPSGAGPWPGPELQLLRGEYRLTHDDPTGGYADLQGALDRGLLFGDKAYALGLLAKTPGESLKHFRDTATLDPHHRPARAALVMGLTLLGRRDEAWNELSLFRTLFPKDDIIPLAEGLLELAAGKPKGAKLAFARFAERLPAEKAEAYREHVKQYIALDSVVRNANRKPVLLPPGKKPATAADPSAAFAAAFGLEAGTAAMASLREMVPADRPLGLPAPVVAKFLQAGTLYAEAGTKLLVDRDAAGAVKLLDPQLETYPDAALFSLSAGAHFRLMATAYFANDLSTTEKELTLVRDRGEAAVAAPTAFAAGTFAYQGRALAAFATGLLGTGFNQPDPARLRTHLRHLVMDGNDLPDVRREVLHILSNDGFLTPDQARTLYLDWALTAKTDAEPWRLLAELETKLGNGPAAAAAKAKAPR